MISLGPVADAVAQLKPPGADAMFLNQALALGQQGSMFQNPLNTSLSTLSSLNLGGLASMLNSIPGGADMAAKCMSITSQASIVKNVSDQMFTKVLPTRATMPSSMMAGHPSLNANDSAKINDFNIPSVTQIMSTAQSEQSANARLGISGSNPCTPVTNLMGSAMTSANKMDSSILKAMASGGSNAIHAIQTAYHALNNAVGDAINDMQSALSSAFSAASGALNATIDKISGLVSDIGHAIVDSVKSVIESAEKAMHVATADMVKSLVSSSPCMKDVLSPGENVYVATCDVSLVNIGSDLVNSAGLLLEPTNLHIFTSATTGSYVGWEYSLNYDTVSNMETIAKFQIKYTIDIDKAKAGLGTNSLDGKLNQTTTIELCNINNVIIGTFVIKANFFGLGTSTTVVTSDGSSDVTTANTTSQIGLTGDSVEWLGAKKQGLLSPEMRTMTAPVE